ncbi:hypothetical protein MHYP_G00029600 [Metynnis hypsauchen]
MSSKSTKPSKKELSVKADSKEEASNNLNMALLASLLEEHKKSFSAEFRSSISILETKLDSIHTTVFEHNQKKERIVREARAKRGKLQYRSSPIAIYKDYAPEVVEQRGKYREVVVHLYNLGLKPVLLFPAKLIITTKDGGKRRLASVEEAKRYLTNTRANGV